MEIFLKLSLILLVVTSQAFGSVDFYNSSAKFQTAELETCVKLLDAPTVKCEKSQITDLKYVYNAYYENSPFSLEFNVPRPLAIPVEHIWNSLIEFPYSFFCGGRDANGFSFLRDLHPFNNYKINVDSTDFTYRSQDRNFSSNYTILTMNVSSDMNRLLLNFKVSCSFDRPHDSQYTTYSISAKR